MNKSTLPMKKSKYSKAKKKIEFKFCSRLIIGYGCFFLTVFAFGLLLGKLLETIFIIIGYFTTRFVVPKIKHFNSGQKCIFVSTLTFLFAVAVLCIPKEISLVWAMGIGAVIPLIMYAESLLFDVKISEKDALVNLCKEHNYGTLKTEIAVKFFIDKEKPKDVWLWLCDTKNNHIEWDSVNKMKQRMKKDLFK